MFYLTHQGPTPGSLNMQTWVRFQNMTGFISKSFDIAHGTEVYISVRCRNYANLLSTVVSKSPAIAVVNPPSTNNSFISLVR